MAADRDFVENEEFYKKLLLSLGEDGQKLASTTNDNGRYIFPKAGFVIKIKNDTGEKIFMNILTSPKLPPPKDISEAELREVIEDPYAVQYKVPVALGDPHVETDKSGKGCTVYNIVINDGYLSKIQESDYFMGFFMAIVYEGIEDKFRTTLSRDWVMLKNKKCFGDISRLKIRNRSKPVIEEVHQPEGIGLNEVSTRYFPSATSSEKKPVPSTNELSYKIIVHPPTGVAENLIVEVSLPGVKSISGTTLDVGDDCLILHVPGNRDNLVLNFPHLVEYESGNARFNKKTKVLRVSIPVKKTTEE